MSLSYFSPHRLHSVFLVLLTLLAVCLLAILSKRVGYLLAAPNVQRIEHAKMAAIFAGAMALEWTVILHVKANYDQKPVRAEQTLCELLLFEHIMLMMRYTLGLLKYTLSLWCLMTGADFRLRFPWYSPLKNSCLILSFVVSTTRNTRLDLRGHR